MRLGAVWPSGTGTISLASDTPVKGTLNFNLPLNNSSDDLILRITPVDGPGTYNLWVHKAANPGDPTRYNQTLHFGYNIGKGGGVESGLDGGVGLFMESHWDDGGGFVRREFHLTYINASSVQTRFLTSQQRTDNDRVDVTFNATLFTFNTQGTSDQFFTLSSAAANFGPTANGIYFNRNNVSQINQLNATSNAYLAVIHLDSTNSVVAGGNTQPLKVINAKFRGYTTTAADPTVAELPADKDFSIHKNTNSGAIYLAVNDGGSTIKKVAMT